MRKIAFALFILMLAAGPALGLDMDAKSFYVHGTFSLPSGDFGDIAGNGFGGGIGIKVPHNDQLNFRGEVGYIKFAEKSLGDLDYSFSQIPIMVLAEYMFSYDSPFYGLGGVGFHRLSFDATYTGPASEFFGDFDDSSTEFGFTIGAGYGVNEQINVEGRYNVISDGDQITVIGTYAF